MEPVIPTVKEPNKEKSEVKPKISIPPAPPAKGIKPPGSRIYVGPNFGGPVLMTQFTVYRGELPRPVQKLIDKDPVFGTLFIPVDDLPKARAALKRPESGLSTAFARARK